VRALLAVVAVLALAAAAWWLLAREPEAPAAEAGAAVLTRAPDGDVDGAPRLPEAPAERPDETSPAAPALLVAEPPGARLQPAGRLRGRVLDAVGTPLPGARVDLAEDVTGPWVVGTERRLGRAETDAEGRFALQAIPADHAVALQLRHGLQRACFNGLAVPAEGVLDLGDIVLPAPAGLSGRVTDGAGAPLRGATALVGDLPALLDFIGQVLDPAGTPDVGSLPARLALGRAVTGVDGRFAFEGLQPGPLVVHLSSPGRPALLQPFVLAPGEQAERTFDLPPGGVIEGRVQAADGRPVPFALVGIKSDLGDEDEPSLQSFTNADTEGRFRLEGVPAGEFELTALARGYDRADVRVGGPGAGADAAPAPVSAGATGVVLVMRPLRALRATVLLPDGSPAPRFALDTLPLFEGFLGNLLGQPQLWRRETFGPAARGEALLRAPEEHRYIVVASGADGLLAPPFWFDAEDDGPDLAHIFSLQAPRVLRGRVTDEASGAPLPGAEVRVMLNDSPASDPDGPSFTDADGRFAIEASAGLPLGLHVSAAGHADLVQGVPEGRDDAIALALPAAGSLRVLIDPDAAPGPHAPCGVRVEALGSEAEGVEAHFVLGTCVFARLPPGLYEVRVDPEEWNGENVPDREGRVDVVAGRQAVIEL
jgi:protocatechuate 3,4-dioxygenase beta subunit